MFWILEAEKYEKHQSLIDQMFRLRKRVFFDALAWDVDIRGDWEIDRYDAMKPSYLLWTDEAGRTLYGSLRLMPTTGPTLLYDVFRRTFPEKLDLRVPGVFECTRICVDTDRLRNDMPQVGATRAMCLMLTAMGEHLVDANVHTLVCNYEPRMMPLWNKSGAECVEVGRADGFGSHPVVCGVLEVSERVLARMRTRCHAVSPLIGRGPGALPVIPLRQRPEPVFAV